MIGQPAEISWRAVTRARREMDAYERVLGDAMEETPLSLPARTTWKRRGGSSIPC